MTKFQELQAKAFELCKKHEDDGKSVVMTDEWLRIYSELIVEECADYFGREGDGRFNVDGNWIAKTIRQQFNLQ